MVIFFAEIRYRQNIQKALIDGDFSAEIRFRQNIQKALIDGDFRLQKYAFHKVSKKQLMVICLQYYAFHKISKKHLLMVIFMQIYVCFR